jgi:NDP-sugar pyrophosphorylase family protein
MQAVILCGGLGTRLRSILAACEQFKINLAQSLMYGDNKDTDRINLPYLPSKIIARE